MLMPTPRKNNARGKKDMPKDASLAGITHVVVPASQTLFPEKLEHAQSILRRTKFLDK